MCNTSSTEQLGFLESILQVADFHKSLVSSEAKHFHPWINGLQLMKMFHCYCNRKGFSIFVLNDQFRNWLMFITQVSSNFSIHVKITEHAYVVLVRNSYTRKCMKKENWSLLQNTLNDDALKWKFTRTVKELIAFREINSTKSYFSDFNK